MLTRDILLESFAAVTVNKARSGLTVLGIVIGIASVIAMVSIGQGAQGSIESSINSIGSNLIMVMPGAVRGVGQQVSGGRGNATTLTLEDAAAIEAIEGVAAVAPEQSRRYQVTGGGNNTNVSVVGSTTSYPDVRNVQVAEGEWFNESQDESMRKVAVIGPTTRDDLFGEGSDAIGETIRINRIEFAVIGVTAAKGGTGMSNSDDVIYVPLQTAARFLTGAEYASTVYVQASGTDVIAETQAAVKSLLLERHKIADETLADFSIMNQSDIISAASSITGTFTMLLAAIAGISLVVGGIGIMNMMLTTVTERIREIGLRKAIGAKRANISTQFLIETLVLTSVGGVVGIAMGWLASIVIGRLASTATSVSLESVVMAFGVSAAIGIVFGYYPAKSAARLDPIEALRYE